ncbi:probable Carboxypeptidase Y [Saccharomycodes ludwigii]|uniref:Carboxypeptidase n=1 Tax=Saccharomycodes ludwigii TaxID=36035 RepID=A0A376B562_9ASCO|nr:hypothetical protein SCDLUD_004850 [Saccharomycodes ludwigii]KAH3899407.1 hypothetical protein SCDLUD_004850 [Saccharomycodes ludwigii]SSD59614.1 probable Carboxypeptidase Y [Saccharomycodes ludwigii]
MKFKKNTTTTLLSSLLLFTPTILVNALHIPQEQGIFNANHQQQHESFLQTALEKIGLSYKDIPSDLKDVYHDIAMRFPTELSQLQLTTSPKKVRLNKKKTADVVVTNEKLSNYQLRVNSIRNPSKLGIDPGVKQYTGYLDIEDEDKHFFYWFFESRNDPKNDPVILWLNGGPGCSSLTGLFFELGPSSIGVDLKPIYNPYSWNNNASVIFLDQPVNVGYSYSSGSVSDTVAAGKDVYAFLELFFQNFDQFASNKFHIAGESYAGHYIPIFASEILAHPERTFTLDSVLIGNGLTDPLTQYSYYEPMACGVGSGEDSVLEPEECEGMLDSLPRCLSMIESCYDFQSAWTCVPASIYCNNAQMGPYQKTGRNVYDIRKQCEGELCYKDMENIDKYLNLNEVKEAVGADVEEYESCNFDVNRNFLFNGDWMKPYHEAVQDLLDQGLPVLIYAGDKDFICNWLGNQAWTDALPWKHHDEFAQQPIVDWIVDGDVAGELKHYKNFNYLRVYGGGHMVPYDVPLSAITMVNKWIHEDYQLLKNEK